MTTTSSVQVIAPQTLNTMTFYFMARLIEASAGTGKTFTIADGIYAYCLGTARLRRKALKQFPAT